MAKARISRINKLAAYYAAYGAYCAASSMTETQFQAIKGCLERACESQVSLSFQKMSQPQAAFMPGFLMNVKSMVFTDFYHSQVMPEFQLKLDECGVILAD